VHVEAFAITVRLVQTAAPLVGVSRGGNQESGGSIGEMARRNANSRGYDMGRNKAMGCPPEGEMPAGVLGTDSPVRAS
jgi:hypothetical protein